MKPILVIIMILGTWTGCLAQIVFSESSTDYHVLHSLEDWTVGGGVSLYDFNGDGMDDLTMSSTAGYQVAFYLNNGTGFDLIPPLVDNTEIIKQILWADYDNDGDPDLYLAAFDGINRLYRNLGNLQLVDVTEEVGLPLEKRRGFGAAWGDINRDGWLDLYYASRDLPGAGDFINVNKLFVSNADGTFTDQSNVMMASDQGKIPFCSSFLDYNNDMWPDIYTANDRYTLNTLLKNEKGEGFIDVSEVTNSGRSMNAMCVTFTDINFDGWLDIYITNTEEGNQFLVNTQGTNDRWFVEKATEYGLGFNGIGWGSNFLDADNDGDMDLYVSGSISGASAISSSFYENTGDDHFQQLVNGGFRKDTVASYSNAIGDWNNDGLMDILVQNNPPDPFHLWENRANSSGHWLKVKLKGVLSNREGIGSRIEIYYDNNYQLHYTHSGFGFLGQNAQYAHFGTGDSDMLDSLVITWPSGHQDKYYDLPIDQSHQITEGASTGGEISVAEDVQIVNKTLTTSINDISSPILAEIYPNPANSFIRIQASANIVRLDLYDTSGIHIGQWSGNREKSFYLNLETFNSGYYLLSIHTDEGILIKPIVKL